MITGPAAGTVGTINSMMHQAFTGNAADLQRQYHGMNSMNAGIAASTKSSDNAYRHQLGSQQVQQHSRAQQTDDDMARTQYRGDWTRWQYSR